MTIRAPIDPGADPTMDDDSHRLDDPEATAGLLDLLSPSDEARALASGGEPPRAFIDRLAAEGLFPDAIKLLALAMTRRDAVWWACRCCRESLADGEPPAALLALEAAERWTADPTEERRRAAHAASEAAGLEAPAGCAALGAFFSGGSIAPPHVPDVPPAPHLAGHVAAGSVMLCAVRTEPEKAPEKYRAFLALGIAVADRVDPPPSSAVAPASASPAPARPASPSGRDVGWGGESNRVPAPSPSPTPPSRSPSPAPPPTRRWDEWE
jgi:hypothetical protein